MTKTARLATRIEPDLLTELDAAVSDLPGDRSDHVRQAIIDYIVSNQRRKRLFALLDPITSSRPQSPLSIPTEIAPK